MKRKALGKGLRSLIPESPRPPQADTGAALTARPAEPAHPLVDIDRISPNPRQPRQQFDPEGLESLARSMKSLGVLQPVLVRPVGDGRYELVAGERRWRAAQMAGILKIPVVVKEIADERLLEFALIENLQREELNPIEEAQAYRTLLNDLAWTQQQVAERVGKQRATVANAVRLLTLPESVQQLVRTGQLSMGQARALAALDRPSEQASLAARIVRDDLSVRAVERLVEGQRRSGAFRVAARSSARRDPHVVAAEENLQRSLGAKVRIFQGKKGGRLEIHYHDDDELRRLYDLFLRPARRER